LKGEQVNHPAHYNVGGIEVIDAIEAWQLGFNLGNTVKYVARAEHKGAPLQDLKKAAWYLLREIERREQAQGQAAPGALQPALPPFPGHVLKKDLRPLLKELRDAGREYFADLLQEALERIPPTSPKTPSDPTP
jgi:hypothetical protein